MERKRILIAVKNTEEIHELRKSLVSSGYEVKIVHTGVSALTLCREFRPHLMLAEVELPKIDGHHLLQELKAQSATKNIPFVLMSRHRSVDERVHSINLGVDDYITTPFDANEVALRIEIILREIAKFEATPKRISKGFSGKLSDLNLVELLQTLEISKKSGIINIQNDINNKEGTVYIKDGEILDASLANLDSKNALFRMFSWSDGTFQVALREINQEKVFQETTDDLLYSGWTFRDRWDKLVKHLPPLQAIVEPNPKMMDNNLIDDEKTILSLIKDKHRLIDLIECSQFDDFKALTIVANLFKRGCIVEAHYDEEVDKEAPSIGNNHDFDENNDSHLSKLIVHFLQQKENPSQKNGVERRRGERRRIDRRTKKRRWSDFIVEKPQIYLNKSELLMIREKLANGKQGVELKKTKKP